MKRAALDVMNGWQEGKIYPDVNFCQAQAAVVMSGPQAGTVVVLISLEALEPEPHYLAEAADGTSFIVMQSEIRKIHEG